MAMEGAIVGRHLAGIIITILRVYIKCGDSGAIVATPGGYYDGVSGTI